MNLIKYSSNFVVYISNCKSKMLFIDELHFYSSLDCCAFFLLLKDIRANNITPINKISIPGFMFKEVSDLNDKIT